MENPLSRNKMQCRGIKIWDDNGQPENTGGG